MKLNKITVLLLMAGLAISSAQAADKDATKDQQVTSQAATAPVPASIYKELDYLRSQNAVLAEKVKNAELKAKLNGAPPPGQAPFPIIGPTPRLSSQAAYIDRGARVQFVAGMSGRYTATIKLSDGGTTQVRAGATVPTLGVVKSVNPNEVIVQNGKETIVVPFEPEPTMSNMANPATAGMGLPTPYSIPAPALPAGQLVVPPINLGTN